MNASVAGRSFPEATDKSSDLSDSVDQSVRQQYAAEGASTTQPHLIAAYVRSICTGMTAAHQHLCAIECIVLIECCLAVEHLDSLFSQVIAKVNDLGERGNTLIVVLSDHGEELVRH